MNLLDYEPRIHDLTIARGEKDGNNYRFYLHLNGVLSIDAEADNGTHHKMTDVLMSHVGEDDALTFLISDQDDTFQYFVGINDLPFKVVKEAYQQMYPDLTQFVKPGVSLYDVVCTYTRDFVNAEEAYALYDLKNRKDFKLFVDMHGLRNAFRYRKQNRYWWDGFNYYKPVTCDEGPKPETEEGMKTFINEYVLDAIQDDKDKSWDISYWGEVLDLDKIRPYLR